MNPLDLLRGLGRVTGGGTALDPMLQTSNLITTQLRKAGLIPNTGIKEEYGGRGISSLPANYRGDELQLAARARAQQLLMGGSGAGGSVGGGNMGGYVPLATSRQAPADRAYQQEKARITQMTEQDPMFKKYKVADLTKAYNTAATPEEKEKIGLQIWATTNPELAQKLRPGQTGFSEAVTAFQSQSPLGAVTKAAGGMQYADLSQQPITTPVGPGGVPFGFSPAQLQTPLTGIEIPPTDKIGVKEFFSDTKPAPGAMEAFTDQMRLFSPEKLDETKRALLIQAFNKGLK
jgi:hypothetical protein